MNATNWEVYGRWFNRVLRAELVVATCFTVAVWFVATALAPIGVFACAGLAFARSCANKALINAEFRPGWKLAFIARAGVMVLALASIPAITASPAAGLTETGLAMGCAGFLAEVGLYGRLRLVVWS